MIIYGRGFSPPAPERCGSENELALATKVGKTEGAISRLPRSCNLNTGAGGGRGGEKQTFEACPPPPAVSRFRPIKFARRPPEELGLQGWESSNRYRWLCMLY